MSDEGSSRSANRQEGTQSDLPLAGRTVLMVFITTCKLLECINMHLNAPWEHSVHATNRRENTEHFWWCTTDFRCCPNDFFVTHLKSYEREEVGRTRRRRMEEEGGGGGKLNKKKSRFITAAPNNAIRTLRNSILKITRNTHNLPCIGSTSKMLEKRDMSKLHQRYSAKNILWI